MKGSGSSGAACGNLRLLTRRHATLRMGISEVSGWGVFSTLGLERDEFVYEYMGEVVSHDEADRRGSIYDKFNHSFLFNLNSATVVDAARKGNKVGVGGDSYCSRFICDEHKLFDLAEFVAFCTE